MQQRGAALPDLPDQGRDRARAGGDGQGADRTHALQTRAVRSPRHHAAHVHLDLLVAALLDGGAAAALHEGDHLVEVGERQPAGVLHVEVEREKDALEGALPAALRAVSGNFNATGSAGFGVQSTILTQFEVEQFLLTADPARLEVAEA